MEQPLDPHTTDRSGNWRLEGTAGTGRTWFVDLAPLPFVVGRLDECDLKLASSDVSRRHAEIVEQEGILRVRDLGSTNGTFVNRERIDGEHELRDGDVVHFGDLEFRIRRLGDPKERTMDSGDNRTVAFAGRQLSQRFVGCEREFREMLRTGAVVPHFQSITSGPGSPNRGYEVLGRGGFEGLPEGPGPLFHIASCMGKEVELSRLFRVRGVEKAVELGLDVPVYLNTLPAEIELASVRTMAEELRDVAPECEMVLEVHEGAVTRPEVMKEIRGVLADHEIALAYDDFGAGQARLVELIEVPPDILKFDIVLIRNIDQQPERSRRVLGTLVSMVREMGIRPLAEGVETRGELDACIALGFELFQGFYFARPTPSPLS